MSLVVNHNLMAANVAGNLNTHYGRLATSTERLSSGLRVNSSADDAAGLAIRELMRADIASLHQGARNANDAISMIQTADAALAVIDEKLIRMKELAEQAATGTYDSTQRLMIDSEFQQMASEIDRIAHATDFNGIHLLDGSLTGTHDGSGLSSNGKMKVHFGSNNDSSEDYYYIEVGDCSLLGLGLKNLGYTKIDNNVKSIASLANKDSNNIDISSIRSGIIPMSYIPKGSKNVKILIDGYPGAEDDIQLFTRDGYHLLGTSFEDFTWIANGINSADDFSSIMTDENGFTSNTYKLPDGVFDTGNFFNGNKTWSLTTLDEQTYKRDPSSDTMNIKYSGDYDRNDSTINDGNIYSSPETQETIEIDNVTEDLLLLISGTGSFGIKASWDYMPTSESGETVIPGSTISIDTQELAQKALKKIDSAIIRKDQIRANLGAMQNRLENTITNITTQAENLQASESRISDVDVATEMTDFVRNQILTQSAVAMLAQANSLPQMAIQIIGG